MAFVVRRFVRGMATVAYRLPSRTLIRVSGEETTAFLQGLITNDMRHLEEDGKKCIFAMVLNNLGRVLFDVLIYKHDPGYLIECDNGAAESFAKHLKMFRVRRKIKVDIIGHELKVWSITGAEAGGMLVPDPRTPLLGQRLLLPEGKTADCPEEPEENYRRLRYELGIGEGVSDIPIGKGFPLESNADYLHGVSFHKGCYIGQELTARVHHTGIVRKRLMPLEFKTPPQTSADVNIVNNEGKVVGKFRNAQGTVGIGAMRIAETLAASGLYYQGSEVKAKKPDWWPKEAPHKLP